ncbi:MAG: hypothetical protein ACI91B_002449 [Planctomycetota bacterium]|jgi:hypothetical protein
MKQSLLVAITLTAMSAPSMAQAASMQPAAKQTRAVAINPSFTQLQLAKAAHKKGQHAVMWQHLNLCIKKLPVDQEAPIAGQLRDFLVQLEPLLIDSDLRQARTKTRVKALLQPIKVGQQRSKAAAIRELLIREPRADAVLRGHARKNASHARRLMALQAIDRRPGESNHRFVLRTAVVDRSEHVRKKVIDLVRVDATDNDVLYVASGLGHSSAKVRMRTADALGSLGRKSAIDLLVKAGPVAAVGLASSSGGTKTRGHVAFLTQTSYIRDFDVEVASAAFIADPKVDVMQEGAVLDATVMGVQQQRTIRRYYRRALRQLAGKDPGRDVTKWAQKMAQAQQAKARN